MTPLSSPSKVSKESCGLDGHEHYQTQQDKQKCNKETVEAHIARTNLKGNDPNIDQGRKDATQSLSRHHASHVVGGKLASNTNQSTLEYCSTDVEQDDYE